MYFDNADFDSYLENLSGASYREKNRLRWYGDLASASEFTFETKIKKNKIGWKVQEKFSNEKLLSKSQHEVVSSITQKVSEESRLSFELADVIVLANSYFREYFVSRCGFVRITIDSALRVFDQSGFRQLNFHFDSPLSDIHIVEVKYLRSSLDEGRQAISDIPFTSSRASKYCIGLQSIFGF